MGLLRHRAHDNGPRRMLCRSTIPSTLLGFVLVTSAACGPPYDADHYALAERIDYLDEAIGGPMARARPGDFLLHNDQIRTVVMNVGSNMGPGLYGGSLIDADLQSNDPTKGRGQGNDQFNEMFPLMSLASLEPRADNDVRIIDDGFATGTPAIEVSGPIAPAQSTLRMLFGVLGMPQMWGTHTYSLRPGEPFVRQSTTIGFEQPVGPIRGGESADYATGGLDISEVGVEDGLVVGDFFLTGGEVALFGPGIGFDTEGSVARAFAEDRNLFTDPFEFPFLAAVGDGVSYGLASAEGSLYVPLFASSQTTVIGGYRDGRGIPGRFAPSDTIVYDRYFFVGHGDVGSIVDGWIQARGLPHGTVQGHVVEREHGDPISDIDVFVYKPGAPDHAPWSQWQTDVHPEDTTPDGSFGGTLPVGTWELVVRDLARPQSPRVTVDVREGQTLSVRLDAGQTGSVRFEVVDDSLEPMPAKITFYRLDAPDGSGSAREPALGETYIGTEPEHVVFSPTGHGSIDLAPGTYTATASRGLEYELDTTPPFSVGRGQAPLLQFQLEHSIDTTGWISADLHVHSSPSFDSGVSLPDRVRTMAAEGVEFFTPTDHDHITDIAPVIESMNMEPWIASAPGVETSTVELGHYLGFPLQQEFLGNVGGAFDWTGMLPDDIIEALRDQGREAGYEPFVFVAHPRSGGLGYFDQYGFDPYGGSPGAARFKPGAMTVANPLVSPAAASLAMDGLEIFTGKHHEMARTPTTLEVEQSRIHGGDIYEWLRRTPAEQEALSAGMMSLTGDRKGSLDDWFALLNLGYRITALGNSDTHGITSTEAGCPRNYVMSETDDPAFIDAQEVADALRARRSTVSYGPFLRMWVNGHGIGADVQAAGVLDVTIEVQAPSWVDVDHVELYENGILIRSFDVPADGPPAQRLFEQIQVQPTRDAWYVAVALGDEGLDPVFTPIEIPMIKLDEAIIDAVAGLDLLSGMTLEAKPFPRTFPVLPYAVTNPIWVDIDGNGFAAPGPTGIEPDATSGGLF